MNTPKLFGSAVACLAGGAVIFGLVAGWFAGIGALIGVGIALYFFLQQLNAYEARDIKRRKKPRRGNH